MFPADWHPRSPLRLLAGSMLQAASTVLQSVAMDVVSCRRCGEQKPALEKSPLPGDRGQRVHAETCVDCWGDWREEQTRMINHEGLQPFLPEDKRKLYERLDAFLNLSG